MRIVAIIVAGGLGTRLDSPISKAYVDLCGLPILTHSISAFSKNPQINAIKVVINREHKTLYNCAISRCTDLSKVLDPTLGGSIRQDSVRLGLDSISSLSPTYVIIHDAARPLITGALIDRVVTSLTSGNFPLKGVIPALAITDTVKKGVETLHKAPRYVVQETLDRSVLWRAQTPQAFDYTLIKEAHENAHGDKYTDDSAIAEAFGIPVALVPGEEENLKITTNNDLQRAEAILMSKYTDIRVGTGIDVHAFGSGEKVTLCGILIPHDKTLIGHSDADVALHAVTDALLATIGFGDIGMHFPPTDPKWRESNSSDFASFAAKKVRERQGIIAFMDVTIICEKPKIGPYREAMAISLAQILGINETCISVKATTTEKLGFNGRGEGITAFATATVRLPTKNLSHELREIRK